MNEPREALAAALWRIFRRPEQPTPWIHGGNLPWNEPAFSQRMLREHLDETHGAASRRSSERLLQIDWFWATLGLHPGARVLDATCGPGLYAVELAERGCLATGVDFSPAAIAYGRQLAKTRGVTDRCTFVEQDVRKMDYRGSGFDVALFLYGQLAVFPRADAQALLEEIAQSLHPGGSLCVELLDQERVDKSNNTWWFTDSTGLWGDAPFLHLGERFWVEDEGLSMERFQILHLETGELDEIVLCDQTYAAETMKQMMITAGFSAVRFYRAWDGLPLADADEWIVYVAERGK